MMQKVMINMFKNRDLTKRVGWSLVIVMIYVLGQKIILPVIDPSVAQASLENRTLLQTFGVMTGSQFNLPTLFSLGIGPYMTGMIVWQAITSLGLDSIEHLSQRQMSYIKKWIALIIAILQALQIIYYIQNALINFPYLGGGKTVAMILVGLFLVAGAMLSIFLGDFLAQRGLGGSSLLILPGILMGLPRMLNAGWGELTYNLTQDHLIIAGIVTVAVLFILEGVMNAERHFQVQRPMLEGDLKNSYVPLRLLTAGAMPFMFSSSLFRIPSMILTTKNMQESEWGKFLLHITDYHTWAGVITYALVLCFLGFAFGLITVQPGQLAKNMKESGEYFLNIFPGDDTAAFLFRRFSIITMLGNLLLIVIGVTPLILAILWQQPGLANYSVYFGSLAILVSITDNLVKQYRALSQKNNYRLY